MKKKIQLPKLVLSKKIIARLSKLSTNNDAGYLISDPTTENPCDPVHSMFLCTRAC
ncbi:MAG: hypothetical protein J7623_13635 [Chitinophaga sp.]|uniref:hypothetical protein n=1 Tax=Chitinophaga sp. TaxID=1869181 RepID=UPI001B0B3E27|nr:hypothetical protein [Chitinophaga sp.]MBO9729673.1 hypothetical protein [Chitinophaga sp.]